jgi:hypothetical protein
LYGIGLIKNPDTAFVGFLHQQKIKTSPIKYDVIKLGDEKEL